MNERPRQPQDEAEINPPWERESARMPAMPGQNDDAWAPYYPGANGKNAEREWSTAVDQSFAGASMEDMSGSGRIAAVVPLQAGDQAWSGGVRAPKSAAMTADEQPSVQMRAFSKGNLARATAIVTAALLFSRVLGLVRQTLFSGVIGINNQSDAFVNASLIPEIVFNIVAGGALASAFIPVFTDYLVDKRDRKTAWHVASSAFNVSMVALTLLGVVGFIFTPQMLDVLIHPLLVKDANEFQLVVSLTRIMLLQPIFLGGATVAIAILQARQSFVLPAIAQVMYNVCLIGGILATLVDQHTHIFGGNLGIYGPTWGVVAGALAQLLIQIPGLIRARMVYRPSLDLMHPGVRKMFRLMFPRLINAAMLYVSVAVNRSLLQLVPDKSGGGITTGYVQAFTLVMLPIGVFGMAVSQASFPSMAAFVAAGEWKRLRDTIMTTVRGVTYLALPSGLGLIALAEPITHLIYGHGKVLDDPAALTYISQPLIFFSIGLLGLSLVEILVRSFYALHDTRTAVQVSILQFMFVIGLSVILLSPLGAGGLALATSLGSLGEAAVLLLLLRPRVGGLGLRSFAGFFLYCAVASGVAALTALVVYLGSGYLVMLAGLSNAGSTTLMLGGRIALAIGLAGGAYFGVASFLGIGDTVPVGRIAARVFRRN
ncbi:MAG TPA: murein biosynthesis integral membrane protein MurJ [Ktedonobacterales bacterium]